MNERKTEAINLRMAPGMKDLLRRAAEHEHRTLSNMLEVLILDYCRVHNLMEAKGTASTPQRRGEDLAKPGA
jgi:hypothetical protein